MASGTSTAPALFLRNATGLVKGWSGFDAFTYSFMSVNLVTLGMFYSLAVFAYVPGANPLSCRSSWPRSRSRSSRSRTPGLIAAMPRAGGDYVWQTRVLDGIPGIADRRRRRGRGRLPRQPGGSGSTARWRSSPAPSASSSVGSIGRLKGGIGFVLAATGWWFILAMWAPIYGAILKIEFFQPLAALLSHRTG